MNDGGVDKAITLLDVAYDDLGVAEKKASATGARHSHDETSITSAQGYEVVGTLRDEGHFGDVSCITGKFTPKCCCAQK